MQYFGRANGSKLFKVFVFAFAIFGFAQASYSQATSGVTGVVADTTGKVVAGATVTLTDTKTERVLTTTTNGEGSYSFNNVPPGDAYKLTVGATGFQTYSLTNVTLGVAKVETYDATLTAGDVSATVEVVAESSGDTLNTTDASIGNVIDTRQLRELPIQIRASPAALIGLQPGVVGNSVGTAATNRVGSVTGSRSDQGNITIDGFDANDQATGQFAATTGNAPIDSVQEFRAISTNPNASEGRSAGGQVQIVTRSGSNDFHGSLREYHRNEDFAANSFFANRAGTYTAQDEALSGGSLVAGTEKQPRPHLVRNQFGGSLGGPLPFLRFGELSRDTPYWKSGKDRLFFFFDYEGRREARGIPSTRVVPLDHVRAGQVAYINNSPGCASSSRLNTTPQCITILSQAGVAAIDPLNIGASSALLSYTNGRYPRANDLSLGDGINTGGFRFNAASQRVDDTYTTRFDANINDSHKLFVRLSIAHGDQDDIVNSVAQQFPGDPRTGLIVSRDYLLGGAWSWVASPNLVNQLSIGNAHSGLDFPNLLDPLSPNVWNFQFTPATCTVCVTDPWASISEQKRTIDTPTFRDDATWTTGAHTLQFGGQWKPIRSVTSIRSDFNFVSVGLGGNRNALGTATRPTDILSTTTAINAWDRYFPFALGRIGAVSTNFNYSFEGQPLDPASGKTRDFRYNEYELYLQDNWKITRSLTLNLGVRWHYYQPPYEVNGFQTTHDVDYQELFDIRVANGAAGIGGDEAEPLLTYDVAGKANDRPGFYKGDWNNFSPRVGFAYSPSFTDGIGGWLFGDRKTSIRGGYNLQYERVGGGLTFLQDQFSFLFDNTSATNYGGAGASNVDLALDPRFTSINSIPVTNIAPVITRPLTPFTDGGVPFGNAEGQVNYTISNTFEVPYYHQYSIGFQRELPGNFLIDVSYVGRLGRKLFTQVDAAQIVDFKDPGSGQTLLGAFNNVQAQVNAGTGAPSSVTAQAFFENQGALAIGAPCSAINWNGIFPGQGITNCTQAAVAVVGGSLFAIGDASDTVQALNAFGTLRNNVGLSGQFSTNSYVANLGRSRYDGLLISVQKRFSNGFQFDANYTYSFAKDNNSSVANTSFGGLVCDLRDLNVCYGPSDFDIRHIANFNGIWELPFGRGKWIGGDASGWVDQLIGGFQLSGIFTYRSGLPFGTTTGSFPVGFVYDSPAVFNGGVTLNGNIDPSGAAVGFFGNTDETNAVLDAFRNPVGGEIGQRNNLRGPSFWNLDLGLAKSFSMPWEGHRLQIRADAFNVFNRNAFGLPNANINSAGFGQITTSSTVPREIQFAIRYDF